MRAFALLFACLISTSLMAHDFFFAHAEVEYNDFSSKLEVTITATTHDLEEALSSVNSTSIKLKDSKDHYEELTKYINRHLIFSSELGESEFEIVGHEISLNGTINIYLLSKQVEISNEMKIQFDLLMNTFSRQQNKITFLVRGNTLSLPYTETTRVRTINIETETK